MTSMHAVSSSIQVHQKAGDRPLVQGMQELTMEEMDQVHGGFGPGGALVGAFLGGLSSYAAGHNVGQIAAYTIIGGVGGFFGGLGSAAMHVNAAGLGALGIYASSRPNPIKFAKAQN